MFSKKRQPNLSHQCSAVIPPYNLWILWMGTLHVSRLWEYARLFLPRLSQNCLVLFGQWGFVEPWGKKVNYSGCSCVRNDTFFGDTGVNHFGIKVVMNLTWAFKGYLHVCQFSVLYITRLRLPNSIGAKSASVAFLLWKLFLKFLSILLQT